MSTKLSFTVYGTEFCRALEAVALFQASPKTAPDFAAVRCIVRYDGLTMGAVNLSAAAVGTISTVAQDGVGVFSLSVAQAKLVLAMFKRSLPKEAGPEEYVLEVAVSGETISISETGVLFGEDELRIAVQPSDSLERGERSDDERVMRTAALLGRLLAERRPTRVEPGTSISGVSLSLVSKAARVMGYNPQLRVAGQHLLATFGEELAVVAVMAAPSDDGADARRHEDSLTEYADRLSELVESGAL